MHGTDIRTASIIFTNTQKSPNSIALDAIRGLFYSLSKHNGYLAAVLQGIQQASIVIDGQTVDNRVSISDVCEKIDTENDLRNFLNQFSADDIIVLTYDSPTYNNPML